MSRRDNLSVEGTTKQISPFRDGIKRRRSNFLLRKRIESFFKIWKKYNEGFVSK
jgi:hypothetical protein